MKTGGWSTAHRGFAVQNGQYAALRDQVAAAEASLVSLPARNDGFATRIQGIVDLLGSASPDPGKALEQMRQLLADVQQHTHDMDDTCVTVIAVMRSLLAALDTLTADRDDLSAQVQMLKGEVATLQRKVDEGLVRIAALERQRGEDQVIMAVLKQELAAVQRMRDEERCRILLGEIAYLIDKAAIRFVHGHDAKYMNVRDLRSAMSSRSVKQEHLERWFKLLAFFKSKGYAVKDVMALTGIVRQARFTTAHGSDEEKASTDLAQLYAWAEQLLRPEFQGDFKRLLELAVSFASTAEEPLVLVEFDELRKRVNAALKDSQA